MKLKKAWINRRFAAVGAVTCILLLMTAQVTYSYLTAGSETLVNTFAGGAISITLDEAKVNGSGQADGSARVTENSYKITPGAVLDKDPTVTVLEGSEECHVFLYVDNPLPAEYFTPDYSSAWKEKAASGTQTLYLYETTANASEADVTLDAIFTQITVSAELTAQQIEELGEMQITAEAYAVQSEGVDTETAVQMAAEYFNSRFAAGFEV